jgi:hydroxylamine reductase (hybrid-cluster protein)
MQEECVSQEIEGNDDDDKELDEEQAKKAALYKWARENVNYSQETTYVLDLYYNCHLEPDNADG